MTRVRRTGLAEENTINSDGQYLGNIAMKHVKLRIRHYDLIVVWQAEPTCARSLHCSEHASYSRLAPVTLPAVRLACSRCYGS